MTDTDALLPCAHCGSTDILAPDRGGQLVYCRGCGMRALSFEAWNRRADTTTDAALVERVARAIHESESHLPWDVTCFQDTAYLRARAALSVIGPAIAEREAEIARLREALRPYVEACAWVTEDDIPVALANEDDASPRDIDWQEILAARAALGATDAD